MKDDLIKFYSRKDVQEEIFKCARGREFSIKFGIDSFGKRPDSLEFSNDILEFIKSGATSFHISEEHWKDPLQLKPGMPAKQLNDLRTGWDLIIDVDCKFWDYSKYITNFIINALRNHGIKSIGCKFSGNKGFHISVPFFSEIPLTPYTFLYCNLQPATCNLQRSTVPMFQHLSIDNDSRILQQLQSLLFSVSLRRSA